MGKEIERLGRTIARRATKTALDASTHPTGKVELGLLDGSMALIPDSIRASIPKGEYMINKYLENAPEYKPGARVVMAWCGNEPVVMAVVVSS